MQSVTVRDGQNLFDISTYKLLNVDQVFEVALLNGLSITDELVSGQVIHLPEAKEQEHRETVLPEKTLQKVFVAYAKEKQTLFDIAVQYLGKVDAVFTIALLNELSITDVLESGQALVIPLPEFEELETVEFFKRPWYPASGDLGYPPILGGIGYMQISTNFKVS